jgi:predicted transcriptional regulator of viral defense system
MNYLEFKDRMFDLGCFNANQVYAWKPGFGRNNFVRWTSKGLLIRLRQGYYTFPEYIGNPDFAMYFANRIYRPSYISLHRALAFYGIIPEGVIQITNVTTLKTANFTNEVGEYVYKSIHPDFMFGYELKNIADGRAVILASPEKALIDLLYIYPFYDSIQALRDLRLDDDFLQDDLDISLLDEYTSRYKKKALERRVRLMKKAYDL